VSANTPTATTSAPPAAAMSRRELAGRALMWLAVLSAAGAAGTALLTVLDADGATKVVETWRMYGLVVFTGLFVLLVLRPRRYRGMWELVIASKLAMTFTAVGYAVHGGIAGAGTIIGWDGGLAAVLVAAYICCRGWTAVPRFRGAEAARHDDSRGGPRSAAAGEPDLTGPTCQFPAMKDEHQNARASA
jgi:hypothetical protein